MELIRDFKDIDKNDAAIAGGKGASLGEMTQAGISVPLGFVIVAGAFEQFLAETDLNVEIDSILHSVNHQQMHTVEYASEKIQALILSAKMPEDIEKEIHIYFKKLDTPYIAVRSSATAEDSASAAWAGQLDSFLNTTEETLLNNVQKCWASLFTPRAIFYRFEKNLHTQKISVAVVIQKMVNSEKSGIAFSVHPVTQDRNQLIIEAGFGLGEAIVSGQITPDSYVVEKSSLDGETDQTIRRIIDKNISVQVRGLYRVKDGGNEWLDIPKEKGETQVLSDTEILELSELVLKIENHYGFPCDIEWAFEKEKFYVVQSRPITTLSGGEHSDLNRFTSKNTSLEHADGLPVYFEMTMAGFTDRLKNNNLSSYEIGISHFTKDELDYISLIQDQNKIGSAIIKDFLNNPSNIYDLYKEWMIGYEKMLDRFAVVFDYDLKRFSDKQLLLLSDDVYSFYRKEVSMPGFSDGFMFYAEKRLKDLIMEYCDINALQNFTDIFTTLTASTEPSFFSEKDSDLSHALDTESKDNLLKKYAWLNSSYAGYKPYTKENIENDLKELKDPALARKQLSDNKLAKQDLIKKHIFNDEVLAIVTLTDLFIKWQDQRKVYTLSYVTLRSKILHEIAQRFKFDKGLLEYALTEELALVLDRSLSIDVLKNRRDNGVLFIHKNGKLQETIVGKMSESFVAKLQVSENNEVSEISGTIASRGKVTGKVRIIMTAKKIDEVEDGEILVAPMTRPEYLIGMKKAIAIVTDDGGITCHAAIMAREMNKPCIIGTKIATKVLHDGDLVEVDANKGVVRILERAEEESDAFLEKTALETPYFNKEDSVFSFESRGVTFLFEDIVVSYYGDCAVLTLYKNGILRVYTPKDEVSRLNKIGALLTNRDIKMHIDGMEKAIRYIEQELPHLQKKQELTKKDVIAIFQRLAELIKEYAYLDVFYSDGVWQSVGKNPEADKNINLIEKYKNEIRDKLNMPLFTTDGWLGTMVATLSKQFTISTETLHGYREKEVVALFDGKTVSEKYIVERKESYAFYRNKKGGIILYTGAQANTFDDAFKTEIGTTCSEIKGIVAHGKGRKVRGVVKIMRRDYSNPHLTRECMDAMKKGDILVSETTDPELMDGLKKAGAIITDIGGMLSHAAITARELDTPCLIGTEIASKVLKDGDLVEVDADEGVVRIL